ncbi:MAG: hypothetical protein LC659_02405 [Myxococcales bacterium]|nr:hypothetical protein [Myxococcales bacterium]
MNPAARWAPHKVAAQSVAAPTAPPDAHADRAVYGLMQPLLGARMLFSDGELLKAALVPAGLLAAFCAAIALFDPVSWSVGGVVRRFYQTFAVLAPLPSVFLARHYARLAALARYKFGFGPVEPCIEPIGRALSRMVKQAVLVALGLVPVTIVLHMVPIIGPLVIRVVVAVWALHWIVVDAFDSARVLQTGQTLADLDALAEQAPRPWFVRLLGEGAPLPGVGRILVRFARWLDKLARPWREEIALVEQHPSLMIGFALSTAALVATPVLNLLFRPIVLIGAAHVLGRLEEPHAPAQLPPVTPAA